jgi:hypothetical protein
VPVTQSPPQKEPKENRIRNFSRRKEMKKKGVGRERKDDEGYGNTHTHIRIASVG